MKKLFTLLMICALSSLSIAQNDQKIWTSISENNISPKGHREIIPQKYLTFHLDMAELKTKLANASLDTQTPINESNCIIYLPIANGQMQGFRVVEAPVMEDGLARGYPHIKTYSIKGIDDVYANGKLDINDFGFHGMIRSVNGDVFIDPYCRGNNTDYISYYTDDFKKDPSHMLPEVGVIEDPEYKSNLRTQSPPATCVGANLRTYRLAVACTGEYAIAATGFPSPTKSQILSKVVTSVNRVDGVYETDVAVRLVLVANDTIILYGSPSTDPFTGNNNSFTLINESQTVCNANIGSANYDIGHTFSTGGGGLANLACVCGSSKARGITGSSNPVGDPYDIDYVAHEMGHQFGGNHTFNAISGSCNGNRNASTSVEPGSGITIMAYAGICGTNDLATNSIAYFHAISYDEIVNFTNLGSGNGCAVTTTTGNNPPVVTGPGTYTIPKSTPFSLTGSATDPNGDPLTFSWEETDPGASGGNWNSGNKPYFMSYTPTPSPTRSFPKLSVILSGNLTGTKGEYCPATAQTLNFRLTARDNKMGGGGVCYINQPVVVSNAGPFNVTYPNLTGVVWAGGSSQTITWNVNGTDLSPVSCANVDVLISYDGGTTFTMLNAGVPNTGSLTITVPTPTATITTCRIKVICPTNIFFDINDKNFTITTVTGINELSSNNALGLSVSPNPFNESFTINARNLGDDATLSITNVLGQVLKKENVSGSLNKEYNFSNYDSGIYFVTLKTKDHQSVARIIKQ
jgi:hypothetical protein